MATILLIGEDQSLLDSRCAILERTGAEVQSLQSQSFGEKAQPADLIILCHSIDFDTRASIVQQTRSRYPGTKILKVDSALRSQPSAGEDLAVPASPPALLQQVRFLLPQ